MRRTTRLAMLLALLAALWIVIATAVAAGYLAGVTLAASRPAQLAHSTTVTVSPPPSPDAPGQDEVPDDHPGASATDPEPGRIMLSAVPPRSSARPTPKPRTAQPSAAMTPAMNALPVAGVASTYGPGWDGWLALPEGPGVRVRICGAGGCLVRTSTDAGPSLAMQRAGRIVDLDVPTFEAVCGVPWTRGLCRVTVQR